MKRLVLIFILAASVLALMLPSSLAAEDDANLGAKGNNGTAVRDRSLGDYENGSGGPLQTIVDAVSDLIGHDNADPDEPLMDIHPPDWDPPSAGPDPQGEDGGWAEDIK